MVLKASTDSGCPKFVEKALIGERKWEIRVKNFVYSATRKDKREHLVNFRVREKQIVSPGTLQEIA